jgi:CTP synthase
VVLNREIKEKIALFCNVDADAVFCAVDVKNIYEVPLNLYHEGVDQKIAILLRLPAKNAKLDSWRDLICRLSNPKKTVTIGIVGKYVDLKEAYKSLHEALVHGGVANEAAVELVYVNSENVTAQNVAEKLAGVDGVLVPGGFGSRGIEGKIAAIAFARGNRIPFFGICLGMQCAVIEFARNVLGLEGANSEEFDVTTPHPVIYLMKEWFDFRSKKIERREADGDMGGTMRLGAYPCSVRPDTRAYAAYGELEISERHRHRYEFNKVYAKQFEEAGLVFSGLSPDGELVEIVELTDHPWFLGCQFHPEFKSNPMRPHPLFREFIRAAVELREARDGKGKNDACPPCPAVSA